LLCCRLTSYARRLHLAQVIDRKSMIDPSSKEGRQPPAAVQGVSSGRIELRSVDFAYPTRPDLPVFHGFNLVIEPGKSTALVGPSGMRTLTDWRRVHAI